MMYHTRAWRSASLTLALLAALALPVAATEISQKAAPAKAASQKAAPRKGSPENPKLAPVKEFAAGTFILNMPDAVEEGGMVLVLVRTDPGTISGGASGTPSVTLHWRGKTRTLALHEGQALALLPAPLEPDSRSYTLEVRNGKDSLRVPVQVKAVDWPVQRLSVDGKYVDPPRSTMDRIAADRARTKAALATVRPERFWTPPFTRPVSGGVSSAFGGKRVFNGQPRSRHRGVDLRGAAGTPIVSAAAGRVILAEEQYFSGNVVYVDHGQGLVTVYCHMSAMHVTPGQTVRAGDTLGLVGSTGRVTGPHLHLSAMLYGESVNPMALFAY